VLTAEKFKPFLLHEDHHLRDAAAEFFRESWSRDVEVAPLVIQACERFGYQENRHSLWACDHFLLSESSLDLVLEALGKSDDALRRRVFRQIVLNAPGELLAGREAKLLGHPALDVQARDRVRRRIECTA
jgi:hypothetical protein